MVWASRNFLSSMVSTALLSSFIASICRSPPFLMSFTICASIRVRRVVNLLGCYDLHSIKCHIYQITNKLVDWVACYSLLQCKIAVKSNLYSYIIYYLTHLLVKLLSATKLSQIIFILFANIIISDDFEENFLLAISNLMFVTPLPQKASRKIQLLEHEIALSS